jgi:hypothetical protein
VAIALAVSLGGLPVHADGYGPYPGYAGEKFPASAAGFATLPTSAFDDGSPVVLSYFLDTTGDRRADVAHAAALDAESLGLAALLGAYVSPSDADVVYALVVAAAGGPYQVVTLRRTAAGGWERLAAVSLPEDVGALGGVIDTPASRRFEPGHVHIMALRRVADGDTILVVGTRAQRDASSFTSRFAILHDGPDSDVLADTWQPSIELPNTEAITLDDRGRVLARRILSTQRPFNTAGLLRVRDSDGDGFPDAADESSLVPAVGAAFGSYGLGDVDLGADRLLAGPYAVVDLDSRHRPIPGSERDLIGPCSANCGIAYVPFQLWSGRDGYPLAFAHHSPDEPVEQPEVLAHFDDLNFDNVSGAYHSSNPFDVRELVRDSALPHPMMRAGHVAELTELAFDGEWSVGTFRSFGVYPGGEVFTFRFGSRAFEHFAVSKRGLLSFLGQVDAPASLGSLQASRGVVAPAWSDGWDTSQVRVFAGYAPANTSFVDGARVLAFSIEWRGLRLAGWEADRFVSMRLVLFSDGSFRTDYGALESAELGDHRFVVGYAGSGNHPQASSLDLSDHSWGFAPAGLGSERVIAEEFGPGRQSDLGHMWIRWTGYPERLDPSNPPVIVNARLVGGRKIVMAAAGSNIQPGATLTVDAAETFELRQTGRGTKWVVKPSARSMPSAVTVRAIWRDGQAHTIVVTNPDGDQSAAVSLP